MAVVVRCPACRGAAQVESEDVGLTVACPQCREPFLAIEEAAVAPPIAPVVKRRPKQNEPAEEPRRRPGRSEPRHPKTHHAFQSPDSQEAHDPTLDSAGRLPASVLIGLALLPFAIPLLWLIGPMVVGQPPALSLAAPTSLALAASSLCLAVVFTVDWQPSTRIKGVLMLVGLSYFAGLSLYFLKKEMVHRAQEMFNRTREWHDFRPRGADYSVRVPARPGPEMPPGPDQPLPGWKLVCYRIAAEAPDGTVLRYVFGSGPDEKPEAADWFAEVEKALREQAGAGADFQPPTGVQSDQELAGQEWTIDLRGEKKRIIRVYRANGNLYYLAVDGSHIEPDDPPVQMFLRSLQIKNLAGK